MNESLKNSINFEDLIQVVIGSSALSVPLAFSEELWLLSESLPVTNIIFIFILSLLFISAYSVQGIFQGNIKYRFGHFCLRTIIDYGLTLLVVTVVLLVLNRLPILSDTEIALKRIIILSFPASLGGVIVDGFDKE